MTDMLNVKVREGMTKATSELPVKIISSDIRTLRDWNSDRGRMVGFVGHTLGRRDSCQ